MVRPDLIAVLVLSVFLAAPVSAFSVVGPSGARTSLAPTVNVVATSRITTRLYADESEEEEEEDEKADEDHVLPSESDTDILNSPAFLARKLDVLQSDIEKAEAELEEVNKLVAEGKAEWGDQLDDLQVEYEKIQERMTAQNKGGDDEATILVVRQMLGLLDNYDRAFGVLSADTDEQKEIEDAYRATYDKILDTFETLGVKEVETVGVEFDYEFHQAVMQRPSEDYEEGIVCEELAKGFVLGDKLIRAAMVSVAA